MAEISKINANNTTYDIKDSTSRATLAEVVDGGAKNRFDPASAWDSMTIYGITITRNGDTYSIASGTTQSGNNNFINMRHQTNTNLIPAGDWVLSFDTPQQNVRFGACWNGALQANSSFGTNLFFTVPENTTDSWVRITLRGNTNMAGTSFKIMLCPRVLWEISQKYIPYALTNPELTVENASQQSEINYAVNTGVKNLCKITSPSTTYGSLTFTVNDDGTVTANGSSGSSDKFFYLTTQEAGDDPQSYQNCILTGCPSGGSSTTYEILTIGDTVRDYGNGVLITSSNPTRIVIAIRKKQTVSNLVFKPMIRSASITDSTFQPYALPNPTLTSDITSVKHMVDPRSQSQVSGGNLDNVTVSEMRVYSSPSGLPTGVSASSVCIVETLVVDSNSAYQVITLLSNQGTEQNRSYPTYKRVKVGGVWYDWKLIVS